MEVDDVKKIAVTALVSIVARPRTRRRRVDRPAQTTSLTIYSGREQPLVKPIMERFTRRPASS